MTRDEALALRDAAILLRDHLTADIQNASTRIEHIRLTQHATEAERLVQSFEILLAEPSPATYLPTHY